MLGAATPRLLFAAGLFTLTAALAWWWLTYGDALLYRYLSWREAGLCLIGSSDICSLARTLCSREHPVLGIAYWAATFWLAIAALSASLATANGPKD